MSSLFYPPVSQVEVIKENKQLCQREVKWFINTIIKPELPSLRETLLQCHDLLCSDEKITLPLSSYQSEMIKGTITRQNFKVINLNLNLKNIKSLNGGKKFNIRLNPVDSIVIKQLVDCDEFILKSIKVLDCLVAQDVGENPFSDIMDSLHNLLISISASLNYLKVPNAQYLFPRYRIIASKFQPPMPESIALDFFINDDDLFMEFHELHQIRTWPWSIINQKTGRSFVDELKSIISKDRRRSINTIVDEEKDNIISSLVSASSPSSGSSSASSQSLSAFSSMSSSGGAANSSSISPSYSEPSFTSALSSFFKTSQQKRQTNLKFLEHCVTYELNNHDKCVVMVKKNFEINAGDPLLLSISSKLGSVENNIMKFYKNLVILMEQ
ncbi:hypothetical protein PACTADRAFT_47781 [Pachysolen tannophilus NRRL Y-2460]|uniref:Uncharacterized protein n=1 Tax=Pachysolen tannophilus NRRL Y-2460 TaxID=669874 RepID=A0A1E4U1T8_PACTA|nr:hypothetical protein PACTADRAFT_47781 [Pachysolen tannophilus NRRL Y-2460]